MNSSKSRLLALYAIAAKYRLDTHLPNKKPFLAIKRIIRLHPKALGKQHNPLGVKLALEEMGVLFLKLGQLLSTRADLLPPNIIAQLVLLQERVRPFHATVAKAQIVNERTGLGKNITDIFARFDDTPLAAASIAQVHTAALFDGKEVIVKVVRPDIKAQIVQDFEILRRFGAYISARSEMARAVFLSDIIEDYRQIILNELDLTLEAQNSQKMRQNFLHSPLIYVPKVYYCAQNVMVSERIFGKPISQTDYFDALGYDRKQLAENGLTIFFMQVFRDNFFHADMHPGNIFVETCADGSAIANPRYIGLDCAIMGQLSKQDQLTVARMLLSVMNGNFDALVDIIAVAGWIPPSTDKHALMQDMARTVGPMVSKPIDSIDFAKVLFSVLDIARRHRMSIPPQLMLLLKTLVHVEGLGRQLYPKLDIWSLARPILTDWVREQLDPIKNLQEIKNTLPELLLSTTDVPKLLHQSLQSLAQLGARSDNTLRELQLLRSDLLNQKRFDWQAGAPFFCALTLALMIPFWWAKILCIAIALCIAVWRMTK